MKLTLLILVLHVLQHIACEKSYEVSNDSLEPFEGEKKSLVGFETMTTIGSENALNGTFVFKGDMNNDDFKVSVELYSSPQMDGDYKRIIFDVPPTNICECFKKFFVQFVQPSFQAGDISNFPYVDDDFCPIPQGEYYVKNLILNVEDWPDQVPRGLVKAIITFWEKGENVGGLIVIVRIDDRN